MDAITQNDFVLSYVLSGQDHEEGCDSLAEAQYRAQEVSEIGAHEILILDDEGADHSIF